MTAAELAARLEAKRNGTGWQAKCPAHDDRAPSLSISEGHDGRVLVKCFAGCSTETIVGALGLTLRDLFADTGPASREIVATYDYTDEHGALLFQVCRFLPKDFRQRTPNGAGGWIWKLDGVRRVLYRLPDVRKAVAAGKRVWIVEGEKDVAAVESQHYTATTNPGGAGKWRPEYTAELRGADVVIVADRDEPGRAHARQVASALQGVAAKVVIVEPAAGKDVSDHLAAGKKLGELVPVPLAEPTTQGATDGLTHIRDLLAEPDDTVSWIVDGLLPAGGLSVIAGKPKVGKSTLARAMALRVSRGEPILGRETQTGPVLYLGLEDPRRVTRGHFRTLGATADDNLYIWTGARPDQALTWLEARLAEHDPVLVVVDTLQHLLGIVDLNDYAKVVPGLTPLLNLARARRAHIMLSHHAGKGDRAGFDAILGSVGIAGTVDVSLLVRRREDNTRTLATQQRTGEDLPESVLTLDANREPHLDGTRAEYDAKQAEDRVLAWLAKQTVRVDRAQVVTGVEGSSEAVIRALYRLVDGGKVLKEGEGVRGKPFLYSCLSLYEKTGKQESENGQESNNGGPNGCPPNSGPDAPKADKKRQESEARLCPKGHRMDPSSHGAICPTCDREQWLATLDAEVGAQP